MKESYLLTLEEIKELFGSPDISYRSVPFWAWNNRIDKEELSLQLEEMGKKGMGGAFPHSREGLETIYMGEEWMDAIRHVCRTAHEKDLKIWLYDEDRWPSGSAGGRVPAEKPEYRAKGLTLEISDRCRQDDDFPLIALYKGTVEGRKLSNWGRINPKEEIPPLQKREKYLIYRLETAKPCEWFNGQAPPDNLNPDCVDRFIELTHESYRREVGEYFGTTVEAVFSDEPGVHDRNTRYTGKRGWIPWSGDFDVFFEKRRNYDPLSLIPGIFFEINESKEIRHDYWRTLAERFSENFSGKISQWCEKNGIGYTGHFLWENDLGVATRVCGAIMPNYRYQHIPAIDILNDSTDEYITVKQCSSVANQYGREKILSETYGCTGWGFSFEDQKRLGDWQYVLGVNIRSQHLALASLRGCRKRDYPPVFNYNTCWWKYNGVVEDYFARIGAAMTHGRVRNNILVIHPASSGWTMMDTNLIVSGRRGLDGHIPEIKEYGNRFNNIVKLLSGYHFDYDLGDETILSEKGRVVGEHLEVGKVKYTLVLLPDLKSLFSSTFSLLVDFLASGGIVVILQSRPRLVEGRKSETLAAFMKDERIIFVPEINDLPTRLMELVPRRVVVKEGEKESNSLLSLIKGREEWSSLFLVNTEQEGTKTYKIFLSDRCLPEEGDLSTGAVNSCDYGQTKDGHVTLELNLKPCESRLFFLDHCSTGKEGDNIQKKDLPEKATLLCKLEQCSSFKRNQPNALTLDTCCFRIEKEAWSEEISLWQAQRVVRERLKMPPVFQNGGTQRYVWIHEDHPENGTHLELKFFFSVEELSNNPLSLCLESLELFDEIQLNGVSADMTVTGWYMDREFKTITLPPSVIRGKNELVLSCSYRLDCELEDCYLLGDFAVSRERILAKEPDFLHLGDWCGQGFLHYCGSITYIFNYKYSQNKRSHIFLEFGRYEAVVMEVRINGQIAGHVPWRSRSRMDISEIIKLGDNEIEVEVMGSPRNLFGPFHCYGGEPYTTDSSSFRTEGDEYYPGYNVRPYGLFEPVRMFRKPCDYPK